MNVNVPRWPFLHKLSLKKQKYFQRFEYGFASSFKRAFIGRPVTISPVQLRLKFKNIRASR